MVKQSPSRNNRSRGAKIKNGLQICVLLAVCFWLIYQVKHSHDKKKAFDESDRKKINTRVHDEILKFGRKELHPRVEETITGTVNHNEEDGDEEENVGEEGNHHEKVEEQVQVNHEEEDRVEGKHEEEEQQVEDSEEEKEVSAEGTKLEEEQEEDVKQDEGEEEEVDDHEPEQQQEEEHKHEETEEKGEDGKTEHDQEKVEDHKHEEGSDQQEDNKHEEEDKQEDREEMEEKGEDGKIEHDQEKVEDHKHEEGSDQQEDNKHEEEDKQEDRNVEEEEQVEGNSNHEEDEELEEDKFHESADEGRVVGGGGGDDEIDEHEQEKLDMEVMHETEDEKAGKVNEQENVDNSQNQNEDSSEDHGSAHEAREENYRADDASSAVMHDTETEKVTSENISENPETVEVTKLNYIDEVAKDEEGSMDEKDAPPSTTATEEKGFHMASSALNTSQYSPHLTVSNGTLNAEAAMQDSDSTLEEKTDANETIKLETGTGIEEVKHGPIDFSDSSATLDKDVQTEPDTLRGTATEEGNNEDVASE